MPDPYGLRRVVRPAGVLPQQADALDPAMPLGDDELLIDVEHLNIDAASFRQLEEAAKGDPRRIAGLVAATGIDVDRVEGAAAGLVRDGIVERRGRSLRLAR